MSLAVSYHVPLSYIRHTIVSWAETEKLLPFSILKATKLTSMLFLYAYTALGHICCYFARELVSIGIIKGWRVKVTLSIKILVLLPPELEFCGLRKIKQYPKTYNPI